MTFRTYVPALLDLLKGSGNENALQKKQGILGSDILLEFLYVPNGQKVQECDATKA